MAAIRGNRGFIAGLTVFFVSIGAALAFQAGDLVEMTEFVNGRSGRNFYNAARNINFVVPKGSEGKVRDVRRLKSGNFGVLITLQNGKHKGRSVWVYYNPQEPWMKLLKPARKPVRPSSRDAARPKAASPDVPVPPIATEASAPPPKDEGRVETKDPREATEAQTTRDQQGVADPQTPDEWEKVMHAEAAQIIMSKIDLVTAEQCSQVLDRAAMVEGYPPGYVAAAGRNARGETGAYLFDHKTARFFKGLTPFSRDGEFREFFAGASESFDKPMSEGVEDLSDNSRAFLAQHLYRKITSTFFNFARASEEAAAPPKEQEQEREQADLIAMIDEANGLKKAKELSLLDDKVKEVFKVSDASLAPPTSRRLPPPDVRKLAAALSICSKVVGEPNVSMHANQLLGIILGQGAAPRAPEPAPDAGGGQPEAAPAH